MEENKNSQNDKEDIIIEFNQDKSIESIIEKYGLDPEEDEDLIVKLVENDRENHKKLSEAIGQKIKYRKETEELKSNNKEKSSKDEPAKKPEIDISKAVQEELDKRDLEEAGLSEELQEEAKKIAKITGVPIKKALQDPYFLYKKDGIDRDDRVEKATTTSKSNATPSYSNDKIPKVDMSTEEGRKKWEEYRSKLK